MKSSIIPVIIFILTFKFVSNDVMSAQDTTHYRYRGVEKCASSCHNSDTLGYQYNAWKKSDHSKSFKSLTSTTAKKYARKANISGNPQESELCLKCHITGEGLDTSYYLPTYRKEDGVTCEACHKVKTMVRTILPQKSACLDCHNNSVHKIKEFDYKEKFKLIAHPRPVKVSVK